MKNENLTKIKEKVAILRKLILNIPLNKPISYDVWKLLHEMIYDITYDLIWFGE